MELRQASRSPLLVFYSNGCLLRSVGIRRTRITPPMKLSHCTPMLDNFRISQMHVINYMHKPAVESRRKGGSSISSAELCKVLWIIEADVADGQLLYITGDPVALGCWDPEMAIPLSPQKDHTNLWKAETKIPLGIHFKYNYFIKGTNNYDIFWRKGPEFSLSIPLLRKLSENITVRDLWLKTSLTAPKDSFWSTWTSDTNSSFDFLELDEDETSCEGVHKVLQSDCNAALGEILSVGVLTTDDSFSVGKRKSIKGTESMKSFSERDQPVEEPWLFRSIIPCNADCDILHDVSDQTKVSKIEILEHESTNYTEKLVRAAEHKLVRVEESVSTVILINSSVCTMQRIAILEDGKLVELLLEPVKNNVQCDSVYLGVVTKLVPHMGGAFVDIGISRPSLMDIKHNREPFAYPPFCSTTKGHGIYGSTGIPPKEDVEVDEHDIGSYVSDDIGNDLLEVHQDDFVHEDFEDHEVEDILDVCNSHKKSISVETVDYDVAEIDLEAEYEENEHYIDSEPGEEIFEKKHTNKLEVKDSKDHEEKRVQQNKWTHVRKGTKVIVQVVKEGLGTKGPALTAYPNLRSRFWILISRCNRIGVSKKITGVERTRLRVIAKSLQPPGFGLTVRTVAAGHSLEELQKDLEGLLSTWKGIVEHAKSSALAADEGVEGAIPVILHRAMGQTLCVVQDYFNDKVKCMVVDSPRTYHEVSNYLQEIAPDLCDRLVLYNKATPIFDEYGIEEEINNILSKRVLLSNGGSLVIEQTEALVSIDVNGGHSMLGQGTSQERAVLDVNLAAAKRIARELRLRDIGGIIVVDFIDMADESNKRLVYEEIKKAVERDKSIVKLSELSRHGLMEITRKRVRPSVSFLISEPCICCHGTGRVEALETSFSKIEREICRLLVASNLKSDPENAKSWPRFVLKVDRYMCNYLTSGKRTKLAILCSTLKVWILLKVARGFVRGEFEVKPFSDDKANDETLVTISRLPSAEARSYIPNTRLTLFPIKKWKTHGR